MPQVNPGLSWRVLNSEISHFALLMVNPAILSGLPLASALGDHMSIRLVVIDGHTLCRYGLAQVAEDQPDLELVGEAPTIESGHVQIDTFRPDVVVTDMALPDGEGLTLVRHLRQVHPTLGVVMTASADADEPMFRAMEAGASAYVAKSAPVPEILAAIRSAAVAPASFSACGLAEALGRRRTGELLLSPREKQVLSLLMDGLSIGAIARSMHLSHSTAKTYTARMYDKLGAANRTQALMKALRLGLIRPDDFFHEPGPLNTSIISCNASLI